jgi:type I restriction enzyme S subunit
VIPDNSPQPPVRAVFAAPLRHLQGRIDPSYVRATEQVQLRLAQTAFPLARLGDLAESLQYGVSDLSSRDAGIPVLRMVNLRDDGWDLSSLKYLPRDQVDLERFGLAPGDLLFNRTNSKELVGKCAVFEEAGDWTFASYLIRLRLDPSKVLPEFVALFLGTPTGRAQIDRVSRQIIGMANINAREIADLLVPLPPLDLQQSLVTSTSAARAERDTALAQAAALDAQARAYIVNELALPTGSRKEQRSFAIRASTLTGQRLDPRVHRSDLAGTGLVMPLASVGELILDAQHRRAAPDDPETLVPYVGLPEADQTRIRAVAMRPFREVRSRHVAVRDDVLFARIEPSVFNQKYVWVELPEGIEAVYTSTEFHVLTPDASVVEPKFLYALLFSSFVLRQIEGKTTGTSGRRRLDRAMLESIQIPMPDRTTQATIAETVEALQAEGQARRRSATQIWSGAKREFELALVEAARD